VIVDQEPRLSAAVGQLPDQVASLLGHPGRIRPIADGVPGDPPGGQLHIEKDVEATQENGVDAEEVAQHHRRRLRLQEGLPGQARPLWRRPYLLPSEQVADRRSRDSMAYLQQLAPDPRSPSPGSPAPS